MFLQISSLVLALPFLVRSAPTTCNPLTNCGVGCVQQYCDFGFACAVDEDCASSSCTANYCDALKSVVTEFTYVVDTPVVVPPVVVPPVTTGSWDWSSDFNVGNIASWKMIKDSYGAANRKYVVDPAKGSAGDQVLQITYPAGSFRPGGGTVGGTGFYAAPIGLDKATQITFQYDVFFPANFNWVKGGKLPGLYGGHPGCSGGNVALDCFSTRFMFRPAGAGELYTYLDDTKQVAAFCQIPPLTICNPVYGDSLGRGSYHYTPGSWTTVKQVIRLNTIGKNDGGAIVYADGVQALKFDQIMWRTMSTVGFVGIDFETFFGGHDSTWATPTTQLTYFKNFHIKIDA